MMIENNCVENGHLLPGDNLLDHIKTNLKLLEAMGLTKDDIYSN